jgi:hypothetical protein
VDSSKIIAPSSDTLLRDVFVVAVS